MRRPESAAYVTKAHQLLKEARIVAANDLADAAGRAAYLAAFHAAQAFVFDATGKVVKSHNGVAANSLALRERSHASNAAFLLFSLAPIVSKRMRTMRLGITSGSLLARPSRPSKARRDSF